jgi:hypothetical protein
MARYWLRTLLGVAIIAGSVAAASLLIYDLVRIGSCSSGSVYFTVNPCPAGTGWKILGMIAAIFVLPFAGMAVLGTRGGAEGAGRGQSIAAVGGLWFFLLFTCMGAAALVAGDGPAAPDEGSMRSGARWVAGTFLVMGAPALLAICVGMIRGGRRRR